MENWKTTVTGFIAALSGLLGGFGVVLPAGVSWTVFGLSLAAFAWFAKDKPTGPPS